MNIYDTDTSELTCSCLDWITSRRTFPKDDPRRLCKHLISKLDLLNLPKEITRYSHELEYYKEKEIGFYLNFDKLLYIPNIQWVIHFSNDYDWMNIFDDEGKRYGFLIKGNEIFYWANQTGKPSSSKDIEVYFSQPEFITPLPLQPFEEKNILKTLNLGNVTIEQSYGYYTFNPNYIIYNIRGNDLETNKKLNELELTEITVHEDKIEMISYYKNYSLKRDSHLQLSLTV